MKIYKSLLLTSAVLIGLLPLHFAMAKPNSNSLDLNKLTCELVRLNKNYSKSPIEDSDYIRTPFTRLESPYFNLVLNQTVNEVNYLASIRTNEIKTSSTPSGKIILLAVEVVVTNTKEGSISDHKVNGSIVLTAPESAGYLSVTNQFYNQHAVDSMSVACVIK